MFSTLNLGVATPCPRTPVPHSQCLLNSNAKWVNPAHIWQFMNLSKAPMSARFSLSIKVPQCTHHLKRKHPVYLCTIAMLQLSKWEPREFFLERLFINLYHRSLDLLIQQGLSKSLFGHGEKLQAIYSGPRAVRLRSKQQAAPIFTLPSSAPASP